MQDEFYSLTLYKYGGSKNKIYTIARFADNETT